MASFVADLRAQYGHLASFAYDGLGGMLVGVTWVPDAFAPKPFNLLKHSMMRLPGATGKGKDVKDQMVTNVFEVLAGMRALGRGLVGDVHMSESAYLDSLSGPELTEDNVMLG